MCTASAFPGRLVSRLWYIVALVFLILLLSRHVSVSQHVVAQIRAWLQVLGQCFKEDTLLAQQP